MGAAEYAKVSDLAAVWRQLDPAEVTRAGEIIPLVSAQLRMEAKKVGKDLDRMIAADPDLGIVAKSVVCDVVARTLMTSTNQEPMVQGSQTAGPFNVSGTFLVPGGGLFIKKSELARLGLRRQHVGVIDFYGAHNGENGNSV